MAEVGSEVLAGLSFGVVFEAGLQVGMLCGVVVESGLWALMLTEVVVHFGHVLLAVEVAGAWTLAVMVDNKVVFEAGTGLSVVVAHMLWLMLCVVGDGALELMGPPGKEGRQIWRGRLLLGCV